MAILDIVLYPNDILSVRCSPVDVVDDPLRQLVDDMTQTMYDAPGIGLAAPQIGSDKRVTVIDVASRDDERNLLTFTNPEIIHREGHIVWEEGCLSIPGIYEKVHRAAKVVVKALDRNGQPFELEAEELLAVALQHEIDHLDGVVFLDHLSHLKRRLALKRYKKLLLKAADEKDDETSQSQA